MFTEGKRVCSRQFDRRATSGSPARGWRFRPAACAAGVRDRTALLSRFQRPDRARGGPQGLDTELVEMDLSEMEMGKWMGMRRWLSETPDEF